MKIKSRVFELALLLAAAVGMAAPGQAVAQNINVPWDEAPSNPDRWFSTFSIIAYDPETQELGVGVQSRAFGAGAAVPYAVAGVGAVATQAAANRLYGPKAIELLKQGLSPAEIVKRLTDEDPGRDTRQLAVINAKGESAVYTGKRVLDRNSDKADPIHLGGYAGSVIGKTFSVQGNTLASEDVVKSMARAYEQSEGTMGERLMDALDAGQAAGGDTRGMQSAGLLVVRPTKPGSNEVNERIVDLRVDDAIDPFKELRRLLNINLGTPASSPTIPLNSPRPANSMQPSRHRRRRWRFSRTAMSFTTPWRNAMRRLIGRCRHSCRSARPSACTRTWRDRPSRMQSSRRFRRMPSSSALSRWQGSTPAGNNQAGSRVASSCSFCQERRAAMPAHARYRSASTMRPKAGEACLRLG